MCNFRIWWILALTINGIGTIIGCPSVCHCIWNTAECINANLIQPPEFNNSISEKLEVLNLSNNKLKKIPSNLKSLKNLVLAYNEITHLRSGDLLGFEHLEQLIISHNKIYWGDVQIGFLQPAKLLYSLDLSHNELKSIPSLVSDSVTFLNLRNCSILYLGDSFLSELPNLRVFDLSQNKLVTLTSPLNHNKLAVFNLTANKIDEIYTHVFNGLTSLEHLVLDQNVYLKKFNGQSRSLNYLDLTDCGLENVPSSFMPNLISINLHGNRISKLPEAVFSNMSNVATITISYNSIDFVHQNAFAGLKNLRSIDLSVNLIRVLQPKTFSSCKSLTDLVLSKNYISQSIRLESKSLKRLDVSECVISVIKDDCLTKMPLLTHLDLSRNMLSAIPNFLISQSLQNLDLSFCRLTNIKNGSFVNLPKLKTLNITGNRIVELKYDYLHGVETVRLSDNSWRCDCSSNNLKELYIHLSRIDSDASSITCQSPEMYENEKLYQVCGARWFNLYTSRDSAWVYSLIFICAMCFIFFGILYLNRVKRKQREREEAAEAEASRERLRRQNLALIAEEPRNAPDPRDLERPPSYNQAISMPQPMGSNSSLASRKSNKSRQAKQRPRRKRRKREDVEAQQNVNSNNNVSEDGESSVAEVIEERSAFIESNV